ncbi:MAG: LCP family protein [Actinomycetota bacterium]
MGIRGGGNRPVLPKGRMDSIIRSGRAAGRPRGPKRATRFLAYFLILLVVGAIIMAAIFGYAQLRFRSNSQDIEGLASKVPNEPMNVLLLGSDTRDVLTQQERKSFGTIPGKRADTVILLHLDEKQQKAVLVQFPRDLRVTYPDGSVGKINAVYQKGPDAMVATVKRLTGLPVNHYVEVDFNGFNNIIDTLGGVEIYFEKPLKDADSGLNVPKGCVKVEGPQALAFVRVRKIDDDFGRIARQQLFVRLMMEKIATPATLLNPAKLVKLVNLFSNNVKHDAQLTVGDVKNIALRLRGFDSRKVDMRVVPSAGARIRGVSYVVANQAESDALFTAIRNRQPLPGFGRTGVSSIEPADVKVTVLNGTSVDRLAQTQASELAARGFQIGGAAGANPHAKTTVYYQPGRQEEAKLIAAVYGAPIKPIPSSIQVDSPVAVVLGSDFAGAGGEVPAGPAPKAPAPAPAPVPAKQLVRACGK